MAEAANDVKGNEIQVMCVKPLIYWARFFVVVTAFSKPQIDAVGYVHTPLHGTFIAAVSFHLWLVGISLTDKTAICEVWMSMLIAFTLLAFLTFAYALKIFAVM